MNPCSILVARRPESDLAEAATVGRNDPAAIRGGWQFTVYGWSAK